jgi:hypothetical protein
LPSKLRDTLEIVGIIQSDIKNGVQIMDNTGRAVISARDDEYGLKSSTIMLARSSNILLRGIMGIKLNDVYNK